MAYFSLAGIACPCLAQVLFFPSSEQSPLFQPIEMFSTKRIHLGKERNRTKTADVFTDFPSSGRSLKLTVGLTEADAKK